MAGRLRVSTTMGRCRAGVTARGRVTLIGIAAILFQALLFGWHHHGLDLGSGSGPAASLYDASRPLSSAIAEDSCEICVALHHQIASPLAFAAPPIQPAIASALDRPVPVLLDWTAVRGFHARAPPRA
jgi:hypothetical protein